MQENEPKNPESQVEKEKEQLKIVEFQGKIEKPIIDSKIRPCGKSIKYFYQLLFFKNLNEKSPLNSYWDFLKKLGFRRAEAQVLQI